MRRPCPINGTPLNMLLLKRDKTLIEFFLFYHSEYRNPFNISEEDVVAAAPFFNVIEEDKDDDIVLDIR